MDLNGRADRQMTGLVLGQVLRWSRQAIDSHESIDDVAIVDTFATPEAGVGLRVDLELRIALDDHRKPDAVAPRGLWHVEYLAAAPVEEPRSLRVVELHSIPVLVNKSMVKGTDVQDIVQRCLSTIRPVHDVVALDVQPIGTTWEPAAWIALLQRSPDRSWDHARLAPDRERVAVRVLDHVHDAAVTREATGCLRGDARAVREHREGRSWRGGW